MAGGAAGQGRQHGRAGGPPLPPAPSSWWGNEFELVVNFEINSPNAEGGRHRRPFVAIWIEDKYGFPVRTLN